MLHYNDRYLAVGKILLENASELVYRLDMNIPF
jgi:hypothetical protein